MRPPVPAAALGLLLALAGPAAAHHVGAWTPRDNEISTNFKQIKFSVQAGKFEVARRLYGRGALRQELQARARTGAVPAGLEAAIAAALEAGDARAVERGLMTFFAALVRDLAREADRQLGAADPVEARTAAGRRFLEAIWRYYNLVDFAVTQESPRAATTVRLAFDEAETALAGAAAPAAGPGARRPPDPDRAREPLRRIARTLAELIEASSTPARRES